jgi:CYTH domain-containing protein
MLRQVMVPSKENSTITLPEEWYGKEVEIIVSPLEMQQPKARKKLPHYIGLNMSDFKFNREEANAR